MSYCENSYSILVVDEDPCILIFIGRLLERDGVRVLFARSTSAALAIAARSYIPIDLILSNVVLPGSSGPEAVNRVRELRPGLNALYMSAQTDRGVIRIDLMHSENGRTQTFFETIQQAAAYRPVPVAIPAVRYQCSYQ